MGLFGGGKSTEEAVNEGLRHIQQHYAEIVAMERKVAEDISQFFNFEQRGKRLSSEIAQMERLPKSERIRQARQIMEREHSIIQHEKAMLEDIRRRLASIVAKVQAQMQEINKIERSL